MATAHRAGALRPTDLPEHTERGQPGPQDSGQGLKGRGPHVAAGRPHNRDVGQDGGHHFVLPLALREGKEEQLLVLVIRDGRQGDVDVGQELLPQLLDPVTGREEVEDRLRDVRAGWARCPDPCAGDNNKIIVILYIQQIKTKQNECN